MTKFSALRLGFIRSVLLFRASCEYYLDCCILFVIVIYVVSLCSIIRFIICYGLERDQVVMHRNHDSVDVFGSSTKPLQAAQCLHYKDVIRAKLPFGNLKGKR